MKGFSYIRGIGLSKWQWIFLVIFFLCGTLKNFIASEDYSICTSPSIKLGKQVKDCSRGIKGLIPYSANSIDKKNRKVSPFEKQDVSSLYYRHWLGTDAIGRDVLAGLFSGANVALRIGLLAVLLSILIGVFLGWLSGYVGDKGFRVKKLDLIFSSIISIGLMFYFFYGSGHTKIICTTLFLQLIAILIYRSDRQDAQGIAIPLDMIIMRLMEFFKSFPDLIIILVLLSLFSRPSHWNIILVFAFVRWPLVTRYLRAEILKIREKDYIDASRAIGLPEWRIFTSSVAPLAMSPVIISSAFAFAVAILLESTLSFLGIGVPPEVVTWGSMLNEARFDFSLWWLAVFPGLLIYLVILLFNNIGDSLSDHIRGIKRK